jgi:hypothetical protein
MLTRGGADRIDGADTDRASGSTPLPALDSGGAERGILTPGIQVGIPTGVQTMGVTGAIGTAADAPRTASRRARLSRVRYWHRAKFALGDGIAAKLIARHRLGNAHIAD